MESELTSIQVKKATKQKLAEITLNKETYDETINRLLFASGLKNRGLRDVRTT